MEVMSLLDKAGMNRLRRDFEKKPDGLSLQEFVKLIMLRIPDTGKNDVELVANLQDLFQQVDVNGDGTMEWEEFSSFCIEAGIAASQVSNLEVTEKFQQRNYVDTHFHKSQILGIKFIKELQKLFVCEVGSPKLKVFDPHNADDVCQMKLLHEIDLADSVLDSSSSNVGAVLDVEYFSIGNRKFLAISSSNMTITFWDAGLYDVSDDSVPRFLDKYSVTKPQFKLCWASHVDCLFMAAADSAMKVLHVRILPSFSIVPLCILRHHTDIVQEILAIPELKLVVTGGLDSKIVLWGLADESIPLENRIILRSELNGHQKGIRSLAYGGDGLVLSTSFDLNILAWDVSTLTKRPIFQLKGHECPLFACRVLPSGQHAVSVDSQGVFKVWDIRREGSILDSERNVQTFVAKSATGTSSNSATSNGRNSTNGGGSDDKKKENSKIFVPFAMDVTFPQGSVIAGRKRLVLFDTVQLQPDRFVPSACIYNPTSITIACAIHRDVKIWDARTGLLKCHFQNLTDHEITSLSLDFRERKFILSDQCGRISVYNYLNGSFMKDNSQAPHHGEISCMKYGKLDKVIITGGWDKTLRVWDETMSKNVAPLRTVVNAHLADITSIAYSHDLSLIASGSDDGIVRIWDFQFLTCEGEILCEQGIASLSFLDPYPLLLVVDRKGMVFLYPTRPFVSNSKLHRNSCCLKLDLFPNLAERDDFICVCEIRRPVTEPDRYWVYLGTKTGRVYVYDFTDTIESLNVPIVPEDNRIYERENYSPYRKLQRLLKKEEVQVQQSKVKAKFMIQETAQEPTNLFTWKAHKGAVASFCLIDDPDTILSCGADKSICLWNLNGKRLGRLDANERKAVCMGHTTKQWHFPIDVEKRRRKELAQATKLMNVIMKGTLKRPLGNGGGSSPIQPQSPIAKIKMEEEHLENERRTQIISQNKDGRRQLSKLLQFEEELQTLKDLKAKQELETRRLERRMRANHVRELNFQNQTLMEEQIPEEKSTKPNRNELSLLDSVMLGQDYLPDVKEQERTRVLGQLAGEVTWVKTQQEIAEEAAKVNAKDGEKSQPKKEQPSKNNKKNKNKKKKTTSKKHLQQKSKDNDATKTLKTKKKKNNNKKQMEQKTKEASEVEFQQSKPPNNATAPGGDTKAADGSNIFTNPKMALYSNLKQELTKVELSMDAKKRLQAKLVDTKPSELLQDHMDAKKFAARISKRHYMSAPLLKLSDPQEESKEECGDARTDTMTAQNEFLKGLSWKYVAEKVKKELKDDLEMVVIEKANTRKGGKQSVRFLGTTNQFTRLTTISARVSTLSPPDPRDQLIPSFFVSASDVDCSSEKERKQKAAGTRLEQAREKLEKMKKRILDEKKRERQVIQKQQRDQEQENVRKRASAVQRTMQETFQPSKEQLKRIKHARYFGPYLRQDVAYIRTLFHHLDADGSGTIELPEFQNEIKSISSENGNFRSLLDNSVSMFRSIDKDESGTIALDELARVLFNRATAHELDDILVFLRAQPQKRRHKRHQQGDGEPEKQKCTRNFKAEIRALFDLYDVNNDGTLTALEMQEAIQQNELLYTDHSAADRGLNEDDFHSFIGELDQDSNRTVDFDEFYNWFVKYWS